MNLFENDLIQLKYNFVTFHNGQLILLKIIVTLINNGSINKNVFIEKNVYIHKYLKLF